MRQLEPGNQIGRYRVLRTLGAGAMGEVYLAEDPQIGRLVALKTVRVEDGRAKELEERKLRLLREARAAGRLLHPNIVTLFDAGEDQGLLYLAFEYVAGTDLSRRVNEGPPLSLGEALSILRQAAEALDYAHAQGVVHRDIKPSNLMLTPEGRVKIADFGIARLSDQTSDLTMTGSVVGSPHYLSPEQIRGETLDGRTDIFSLGVMFYEMLCRRRPFDADTLTTLVYQILHKEPEPLDLGRLQLGPRVEALLGRMLHKDRAARFATAGDLAREIARLERELELQSPPVQGPQGVEALDETYRLGGLAPEPPSPPPSDASGSAVSAAVVAPPAPPLPSAPPVAPPPAAPPTPSAAAAGPPRPRVGLWVGGILVVLLLAGSGTAFLAWRWYQGWKSRVVTAADSIGSVPSAAPTPVPLPPVENVPEEAPRPLEQPVGPVPVLATPSPPPVAPRPTAEATAPQRGPVERPVVPPEPEREPETRRPVPTPAPAPPPQPEPQPAPESRARPEETEESEEEVAFDRRIESGLGLAFDVKPENAIVRVGRVVIGQAREWNPKKKGRVYDLPRPGRHLVRIFADGKTLVLLVEARPGGPSPTWITADLEGGSGKRRRD